MRPEEPFRSMSLYQLRQEQRKMWLVFVFFIRRWNHHMGNPYGGHKLFGVVLSTKTTSDMGTMA